VGEEVRGKGGGRRYIGGKMLDIEVPKKGEGQREQGGRGVRGGGFCQELSPNY
jgi:hypothetical protein